MGGDGTKVSLVEIEVLSGLIMRWIMSMILYVI